MSNNSNKIVVPEAKAAMEQFKMEAASEVGVNLKQGYNGELTSKQAGSIGGQMVKNVKPVRSASFVRADRNAPGHAVEVRYIAGITILPPKSGTSERSSDTGSAASISEQFKIKDMRGG